MHNISAFINRNHKKFLFSLCLNILLLILFNVFFYCRYHTVDDVFMEMIACGAFGKPDQHLIYINVIPGFLLKALYSIFQRVPWYSLMQIIFSILSFSSVMYVFFNREDSIKYLILMVIVAVSYEAYTRVQFTKTAAFLTVAGYTLIVYCIEKKQENTILLFGVLFLLGGFMMRPGMFFGCSAVCLGGLLPIVFRCLKKYREQEDLNKLKRLFFAGFCSLVLVGTAFLTDKMAYSSDEWKYYKHYNEYITQLEDINFPSYELYQKEYEKLNISNNDYTLYSAMDQNDPDLLGIDKMEKIKNLQPHKTMNIDEFIEFLLKGKNKFFKERSMTPFTIALISALLIFVFGSKWNLVSWSSLIFTGFASFVCLFYTYMMHRWLDRTTISVVYAAIITTALLIKSKDVKIVRGFIVLILCLSVLGFGRCWKGSYKWNMQQWITDRNNNQDVLNEIYKDKEHLYIGRTSLPLWKAYYAPYDGIKKGAMANFSPLGDWLTNAPFSIEVLENYNVFNPYKDVVNNEKVYLVGDENSLKPILQYIQDHYNKNAKLSLIRTIGVYGAFSVIGTE